MECEARLVLIVMKKKGCVVKQFTQAESSSADCSSSRPGPICIMEILVNCPIVCVNQMQNLQAQILDGHLGTERLFCSCQNFYSTIKMNRPAVF